MSDNTRRLAIEALGGIFKGRKPKEALASSGLVLAERDKAFGMELVYGVLRHRDSLDWIARRYLKKPRKLDEYTINNIRLALFQIFHMRVPEWAAVNESVDLETRQKALVNAVLRSALREKDSIEAALNAMERGIHDSSRDDAKRAADIATFFSHPLWLVRRWVERFGADEAAALARASNTKAQLTLRINTLRTDRESLISLLSKRGIEATRTLYSPHGIKLTEFHAFSSLPELRGLALVQDEAAQLASLMLAPKAGENVLDACAAPGGKATHMAQLMEDTGRIIAADQDEKRLGRLNDNIQALGLGAISVLRADMNSPGDMGGPFDRIMLDAPCSALGVIRRNPDVRYRHGAKDLRGFGQRQLKMLRALGPLLKPGGRLLFATCSTEPEEGEDVIAEFLKSAPDFIIIEDTPVSGDMVSGGIMRTYPHRHDMDGFFAALMERTR